MAKKVKYQLRADVRHDLLVLNNRLSNLLEEDLVGFVSVPSNSVLPVLFRVYAHLVWCHTFHSWFKKVYYR